MSSATAPAGYDAALQSAALFDLSARSKVELTGRDRAAFLQNFCTNDILKTSAGSGCEAFVTTAQAKIVAWVQVTALPEALYLDAEPGLAGKVIAYLERYVITEDVQFADVT